MADIQNFPTSLMYAQLPSIISKRAGSHVLLFVPRAKVDMGNILIVGTEISPRGDKNKSSNKKRITEWAIVDHSK